MFLAKSFFLRMKNKLFLSLYMQMMHEVRNHLQGLLKPIKTNGPRPFSDTVQDMVAELSQEAAFLCRAEALVVKDGWQVKSVAS